MVQCFKNRKIGVQTGEKLHEKDNVWKEPNAFKLAFFVLVGLKNMPVYIFWPAMILLIVGFIMAVVGFFSNSN